MKSVYKGRHRKEDAAVTAPAEQPQPAGESSQQQPAGGGPRARSGRRIKPSARR